MSLPHTWRPLGVRIAATGLFSMLAVVVGFAWFSFDAETRAAFTPFQIATLIALGLLAVSLGFALARSRVVAEPDRLVVVNGYRRREYDYAAVVDASLAPGATALLRCVVSNAPEQPSSAARNVPAVVTAP